MDYQIVSLLEKGDQTFLQIRNHLNVSSRSGLAQLDKCLRTLAEDHRIESPKPGLWSIKIPTGVRNLLKPIKKCCSIRPL